jgi:phosphoribosylformimino-5-aminoimidazole carboxamide ribotide isomerase
MELWPAIDLRGGCCVRLQQGDYGRETVFGEDPVETVKQFTSAGSRRLHIVDLEGAKDGAAIQSDLIRQMVATAGVPCQVGGGIRSRKIIESYLEAGVSRLVMGSVAIEQPDLFAELAHAFPDTLVLGLDAREGKLAARGWLETSTQLAVDVAAQSAELPLAAIVYTDIARDGMLQGPNLPALEAMVQASPHPVVASGGIAEADDLRAVAATGASGCIVGRALYDGGLTLSAAIEASGESL